MKRPDRPVGIIGAGRLGQAMARTAPRAGRPVVIANSRGPESLASVASALGDGASAGTVADAAASGSEMQRVGAPLAGANLIRLPAQDHWGSAANPPPTEGRSP
jgi:8-hydroxy-5-deazaflavin:NADPH oxidoreductase